MSMTALSSIVNSFEAIPTELAHQILDDLRVWDILKLLCYQNDRVDEVIISHPACRTTIRADHQNISEVRFAAQFYKDVFSSLGKPLVPDGSPLGFNIHRPQWTMHIILDNMHARLYDAIRAHWQKLDLTRFGAPKSILFANWPRQKGQSFEEMKASWDEIQAAKATLFKQTASELYWAADMLEANPDILKRTLDPGQERRPNTAHIVLRMRRVAAKILRSPREKFVYSEHFGRVFVAIIPFDSALNEMLQLMQSQGVVTGNQVVTDSLPPSVTKMVHIVISGMSRFYASPLETVELSKMDQRPALNEKGEILRTGNTPWSEQLKVSVPINGSFFAPYKTGSAFNFRRPISCNWDPHSEIEKEWLEGFVGLYRYLKGAGE